MTERAPIQVRRARPNEQAAIGELTVRAYLHGGHVAPADHARRAALRDAAGRADKAELLVAHVGTDLVGTVTIADHDGGFSGVARPGELSFRMLAVDPWHVGSGVGTALVRHVIECGRARGRSRVVLRSEESMRAAHRLYRRAGFQRVPDRDTVLPSGLALWAFVLELPISD